MSISLVRLAVLTGNGDSFNKKTRVKDVTSLCCDSRKATVGSAFFCIVGALSDGHDFALSAYERGCRVFIAEHMPDNLPDDERDICVFICKNGTRAALADISAEFYGHPEKSIRLLGITGTKGKTTTALLLRSVLGKNGIKSGYIGTNGVDFDGLHYDTTNTTPESCDIYEYLSMMVGHGVDTAVIEVSSQALKLGRIRNLMFDTCVFTNLSPDHIGKTEHADYAEYTACKLKLFSEHCSGLAVINADDEKAGEFSGAVPGGVGIVYYSAKGKNAEYRAENTVAKRLKSAFGTGFVCVAEGEKTAFEVNFPGDFSVANALAVIAVCRRCGLTFAKIRSSLSETAIDGRFELVTVDGVDFVIDYAHNGASLSSALSALRKYTGGRLICLFGSVGCRTRMRRGELGRAAASFADFSILTSDNPDSEPPEHIIGEIACCFNDKSRYAVVPDRREAILYARKIAKKGDIVLLAGKGHENYQLVCGKRIPFSEREILLEPIALNV